MSKPTCAPDTTALAHSDQLREIISAQIDQQGGQISFQDFMQMALYQPGLGYYAAGAQKFGAGGDFTTAPELSPLFSQCLARQIAQVLSSIDRSACVLELGAGSGVMARDILIELEKMDCLPDHYYILELSPELKARQASTLQEAVPHLSGCIQWLDSLDDLSLHGVIIANEVLDAMPVQCFTKQDNDLFERSVCSQDGMLSFGTRPADESLKHKIETLEKDTGETWPVPYHSELNPQLPGWMQSLADTLAVGAIILIDYGYPRREYYHPQRQQGTLIAHFQHRVVEDVFQYPGLQDISANVDFTAVAESGTNAGLDLAGYTSQAMFLLANGLEQLYQAQAESNDRQRIELSRQIKLLTLPSEMGDRFQVIGFTKQIDLPLQGFSLRDLSFRL